VTLSPEGRRRAWEIAQAAPPFSAEIRDQIHQILWGAPAPKSPPAEAGIPAADAA
jgi:hypothetical protein